MREQSIFIEALEKEDPAEREAFLERACAADPALRPRIERLFQRHEETGNVLDAPSALSLATIDQAIAEGSGTTIGPYKLMEQIGEGGMGTVYVAEQSHPVRRRVALKLIKPGMDTKQVIARFEAERQALAMMDHPNIARVLDAGTTDMGRPYFVMELVRGISITAYCDREQLSITERLELFVLVCRAVQHAHQKGIIHRDLKPSNILVTVIDGAAVPKVIDFGVAKATGASLTDRTIYTGFHQFIGTPLYMSPEQADLSGMDMDTRSDIYSLGVLLYELLTGTTPFDQDTFRQAAFDEIRRIIREDEPPRPSTRLSSLGATRSTVSANRKADARHLDRTVHGELDWIVMKALEKDRKRRYETANDFAADVLNYLADRPVEACPPSSFYRLRKFVGRNRSTLLAASLAAAMLTVILSVLSSGAMDRASLRSAGEEALAEADRSASVGRTADELAAVRRAESLLVGGRVSGDRLRDVQQRRAGLELVVRLDSIRLEMAAVRDEQFDDVRGDSLFAEAFRDHGLDPESIGPTEFARRLPTGRFRDDLVAGLDEWARVRRLKQRHDDQSWRRLLAAAHAADPDPWRRRVRDAIASRDSKALKQLPAEAPVDGLGSSGVVLLRWIVVDANGWDALIEAQRQRPDDFWLNHALARHYDSAQPPRLNDAIAFYRAALAIRPNSPGVLVNLGIALESDGRLDEAIGAYRRAIRLKPDYSGAQNGLGNALNRKGQLAEAIVAYREAIRLKPDNGLAHYNLAKSLYENGHSAQAPRHAREAVRLRPVDPKALHNLGVILSGTSGDADEAERAFREAIRLRPNDPFSYDGLGSLFASRRDDHDTAIRLFRRAIELDAGFSLAHANLGKSLLVKGDIQGAIDSTREAVRISSDSAWNHDDLAAVLLRANKIDEAIVEARRAIEMEPRLATAHRNLGLALLNKGEAQKAITELRSALTLDPNDGDAYFALGTKHLELGAWANSVAELTAAVRLNPSRPEAHCNLGHALREQGRLVEALAALRRGHELGSKKADWPYPSDLWVRECEAMLLRAKSNPSGHAAPD